MKRLLLLILFYWILLIENGTHWLGVLFDLGNGFEIRFSLLFKVLFLVLNLFLFLRENQKYNQLGFLFVFMSFLFLSTLYVGLIHPQHFANALSVNLHIQLVLNIIIFIYWSRIDETDIESFINWLRFFGLFNAGLVILSFLFPTLISTFEAGTSNAGITRAFGIMGDEVSLFLTFFFFDSLIFKQYIKTGVFAIALFCTGSIGAFITFITLIGYYIFYIQKITKKNLITYIFVTAFLFLGIFVLSDKLQELTVIKRTLININNPEMGSANLRFISLTAAYDMTRDSPIMGTGFGAYRFIAYEKYNFYIQGGHISENTLESTYNPYIQMFGETGIVGLFFFIFFLYNIIKASKPKGEDSHCSQFRVVSNGWLTIFMLTCLSANWLLPGSFLFILIASLVGISLKLNELNNE